MTDASPINWDNKLRDLQVLPASILSELLEGFVEYGPERFVDLITAELARRGYDNPFGIEPDCTEIAEEKLRARLGLVDSDEPYLPY